MVMVIVLLMVQKSWDVENLVNTGTNYKPQPVSIINSQRPKYTSMIVNLKGNKITPFLTVGRIPRII